MLSWDNFAALWTFPNDKSSTVNAVLNAENNPAAFLGNGNGRS